MYIYSDKNIFGPQPFFTVQLNNSHYYWQNLDFEKKKVWSYTFDEHNIMLNKVKKIGVAANDQYGLTEILNIDIKNNRVKKTVLNE